jgi:hypothetical protein
VSRRYRRGHRYVSLENRSWHAGVGQVLDWRGQTIDESIPGDRDRIGARRSIGVELVYPGYARKGLPAGDDWPTVAAPNGEEMRVPLWQYAQLQMLIDLGVEIVTRWPQIGPDDWHGHVDVCPARKVDPLGFPFAAVLRSLYGVPVEDVWTPFLRTKARQSALWGLDLYDGEIDGQWGSLSQAACSELQRRAGLGVTGLWSIWCGRAIIAERASKHARNEDPHGRN